MSYKHKKEVKGLLPQIENFITKEILFKVKISYMPCDSWDSFKEFIEYYLIVKRFINKES